MISKKPELGVVVEINIENVRLGDAQPALKSIKASLIEKDGQEFFKTVNGLMIKAEHIEQWSQV